MVGNRHMCIAQQSKATSDKTGPQQRLTQSELYRIPSELIQDMFSYMVRFGGLFVQAHVRMIIVVT